MKINLFYTLKGTQKSNSQQTEKIEFIFSKEYYSDYIRQEVSA